MGWFTFLEALAVPAILVLNILKVPPFATGTLLFVLPLGWLSLRRRGLRWRDVGFRLPPRWPRSLAIGLAGGVLVQAGTALLVDPLLRRAGMTAPRVEGVTNLASAGPVSLALTILAVWVIGGVLEEMCFRGYLLSRVRDALPSRHGPLFAVLMTSAYFGLSHWYQGPMGAIDAAVAGAAFGTAYVLSGFNLFLPIVLHGALDTVGVLMLAAGIH